MSLVVLFNRQTKQTKKDILFHMNKIITLPLPKIHINISHKFGRAPPTC
jgi:hypothetical protein